ncbi:MAG: response regulator [Ignavibacteria bacterium]|jgi:sigma-B regulation protein RsbU (phosphoserine phosphatase)|nr:response regulator [Ignavibacteria bacterium]MCU7501939.1 response regulator [Ignavibacteria bacterium]MCU7514715.1 response regulator [Ignavibacteria bacterium]
MDKDKILIVEDEEDTRFILERLLSKNDYEVKTANNGQEALQLLDSYMPKVVVADWTMPVMDGIELCNVIKKNDKYKLIYFILLTARASLKDRVTGLDIGADDFLVKPIENQELLARIRSGIRIHNLQNELKSIEHNKALVEMACTIGHQINNPLSSLIMSLKSLEAEMESAKMKKPDEDFYVINESIERIKKFVQALINLENPEIVSYTPDSKMLKIK